MGCIKRYLAKVTLPDRQKHSSRLFVDLAENVHIHHRDFRVVFSLDEFFEYVDVIYKSMKDIKNYLLQNPRYREQKITDTIMIAGGRERQLKFLVNSPSPNRSYYFPDDFAIELQEESVIDEIHIHYRDFRLVMKRDEFKIIAQEFTKALNELQAFERDNRYVQKGHSDREIEDFNINYADKSFNTGIMGASKVKLNNISSRWYKNIARDFIPNAAVINELKKGYKEESHLAPILLSTEPDGSHFIIDGHHRCYAAYELGLKEIDAVICELTFAESEDLRKAENLLKNFDKRTDYQYNLDGFFKEYISFKLNSHYRDSFIALSKKRRLFWRVIGKIKYFLNRTIKSEKNYPF